MRPQRLLIPLALLTPLALASPAMAADQTVRVQDFDFLPKAISVDVGDTVTWSFENAGHTTTSDDGQPDRWDSGPESNAAGTTYPYTFSKPGRYSYYCIPHQSFMKGAVTVGEDRYAKSYSKFKQVRRGKKITFSFTLKEPAKVVAKLKGASRKSATRRRLSPGRQSIAFRGLKAGQYKGTVTFTDDFDETTKVKTSTVIR